MPAKATAARRIQRRQALLMASNCEFALRATKFRKTMPPIVSDSKVSVPPRNRTERKPKIWRRRAIDGGQGRVTWKGISPRVMCPSEARTCQRIRYPPGLRAWASEFRVSAAASLLIVRSCVEASGLTRVRRERVASIRTLKRSLMGTLGPATAALADGLDSKRMACAMAEWAIGNMAGPANNHTARRTL